MNRLKLLLYRVATNIVPVGRHSPVPWVTIFIVVMLLLLVVIAHQQNGHHLFGG